MTRTHILLIDNYDSFSHNLARYVRLCDCDVTVVRNDKLFLQDAASFDGIIISPGPCTPDDAGLSKALIQEYYNKMPILGVCLGHQAICSVFGGTIMPTSHCAHGVASDIRHDNETRLFKNIPSIFAAGRYHSLIADIQNAPDLQSIAVSLERSILMGVKHKKYPVYGIQFHPESLLTPDGLTIIKNFVTIVRGKS